MARNGRLTNLLGRAYKGELLSLRIALVLVAIALGFGVVGFMILEGYSLEQAFYMTVITISTVGYGEVQPLDAKGRLFTSVLILLNIGVFAYLLSAFTYFVVQGEIFKNLHARQMERDIAALEGHIILCGYGRHGREAAAHFRIHRLPFVVIEKDPEAVAELAEVGCLYIADDATHDDVLQAAGIQRARALVTALPDDTENVFTVLSAREMNPDLHIIARAYRHKSERKLRLAGANHVILPEQIGGFYMATLITKPNTVEFFNYLTNETTSDIGFEELAAADVPASMRGQAIRDLGIRPNTGANIIGIKHADGHYTVNPGPEVRLEPGMSVIVLGSREQLQAFRRFVRG